jgi:hypothetical protein
VTIVSQVGKIYLFIYFSIQAPGAEEKSTRTIRLYREREAKWVALLGSMDPIVARDSRKVQINFKTVVHFLGIFFLLMK